MKRSLLIACALALAVGAWLASGFFAADGDSGPNGRATAPDSPPLPAVQVRTLVAERHTRVLSLFGRTEALRTVNIGAETTGRVVEQTVAKGSWVEEGAVILRLGLDDREARLRAAEALVKQRTMEYEAARKLLQSGFQSEVRKTEQQALLELARAGLEAARLDIERTAVRAPFRGIVDRFLVEVGDYVDVHQPLVEFVDLDPILVVAEVSERDVGNIRVGRGATVRLVTGDHLEGKVRYVASTANAGTRTFRVEIEIANADGRIPDGLTAEVRLPLGEMLAHLVTPAILTLDDAGVLGVKTIDDNDVVAFRPVRIIDDTVDGMWLAGLPERVRLITLGQEFVRDGQRVRAVDTGAAPASGAGAS